MVRSYSRQCHNGTTLWKRVFKSDTTYKVTVDRKIDLIFPFAGYGDNENVTKLSVYCLYRRILLLPLQRRDTMLRKVILLEKMVYVINCKVRQLFNAMAIELAYLRKLRATYMDSLHVAQSGSKVNVLW